MGNSGDAALTLCEQRPHARLALEGVPPRLPILCVRVRRGSLALGAPSARVRKVGRCVAKAR